MPKIGGKQTLRYVSRLWIILLLVALCRIVSASNKHTCHACFSSCTLKADANGVVSKECDCVSNESCHGDYCFSKIELWHTEEIMTVQKGCRNEAPGGQIGCNYAGTEHQINCYCTSDYCNTVENFKAYSIERLPIVECCECNYKKHDCDLENCRHKCMGNYCYLDFEANVQGCGWGFPRLWEFARAQDFVRMEQDEATCLKYTVGHRRPVIGCTCTTRNLCNRYELMKRADDRREATKFDEHPHACYSISVPNQKEMPEAKIFENATQCTGQYCYITLMTTETGLDYNQNSYYVSEYDNFDDYGEYGRNGPRGQDYNAQYGGASTNFIARQTKKYSINAGCMSTGVHPIGKVSVGCYEESQADNNEPLHKHCICQSHLCNYIFAVSTDFSQLKLLPPPRRRTETEPAIDVVTVEKTKPVTTKLATKSVEVDSNGVEAVEIDIPVFTRQTLPTLPPTTTTRQPPNTTPWNGGGWEEESGPFSKDFSTESLYNRGRTTFSPKPYYTKVASYSDENFGKVTVSLSDERGDDDRKIVRDNGPLWPTKRPTVPPPKPPFRTDYRTPTLTKGANVIWAPSAPALIAIIFLYLVILPTN